MRKSNVFKTIALLLCVITIAAFCGCGATEEPKEPTPELPPEEEVTEKPSGFTLLTSEKSTGVKTSGIGVEFDPLFFTYGEDFMKNDAYFENVDVEEYWQLVSERLDGMKIDRFRCMVIPSWFEPVNDDGDPYNVNLDGFDFDTREIKSLRRVLDMAESKGIKVTLVSWGVPKNYFMSQGNSGDNWVVGAKGETAIAEYCENFSAIIQYLTGECKYTCIDQITPGNEPDWAWKVDEGGGDATAYAAMCRELDRRFKADGIRDKVKFNLGDATDTGANGWFGKLKDDLKGIADVINTHTYIFSSETENETIADWVEQNKAYADYIGADYFIGEFGSYGDGDIVKMDSFERGVGLARQMLNFWNYGASGMSYWILFDQHYSLDASSMSANGMWYSYKRFYARTDYENIVKKDFMVRNHYYMYAMASESIGVGADIYPLDIRNQFIVGTRFDQGGKDTYMIANQTEDAVRYCFRETDKSAEYEFLVYERDSLPEGDEKIAVSNVLKADKGYVAFVAPAESVLIVRQK